MIEEYLSLRLIWTSAIVMVALALVCFAVVTIRQSVLTALEPARRRARRDQVRRVLELAGEHADAQPDSLKLPKSEILQMEGTALQLVDEVSGEERSKLVGFLLAAGTMTRAVSGMAGRRRGVRRRSAALLGLFDDERADRALWTALGDPDMSVRLAAASSLVARENGVDLAEVMEAMDRDGALTEAEVLLYGSRERRAEGIPEGLHGNARLRLFGLALFGRTQGRIADATLVREMRDEDPTIRIAALDAVPDTATPALKEAVVEALGDEENAVRVHATMTAGRIGIRSARTQLEQIGADADPTLGMAAKMAVKRIDAMARSS